MGVRASVRIIPHEAFDDFMKGDEPGLNGEPHFIDKNWYYFHGTFKGKGEPLCRVITGDVLHPQCPQTFDEFCTGDHDYYFSFMSPELVKQIAAALADVSLSQLQAWHKEENEGDDMDLDRFASLKDAYTQASQRGDALSIVIA